MLTRWFTILFTCMGYQRMKILNCNLPADDPGIAADPLVGMVILDSAPKSHQDVPGRNLGTLKIPYGPATPCSPIPS